MCRSLCASRNRHRKIEPPEDGNRHLRSRPFQNIAGEEVMVWEDWVVNKGVRLHYLDCDREVCGLVPIIFVPGALASAEVYASEMAALAPRRCIAVTLRGRGQSDAPETGYSFGDHVSDIDAIISQLGLSRFCLMAHSMGVPFAIACASHHPRSLAGLIIADYPASYPALEPEWVEQTLSVVPPRARPHVIRGLQRESAEVLLWDSLNRMPCFDLAGRPVRFASDKRTGGDVSATSEECRDRRFRGVGARAMETGLQ
jgi:pimeloyl-ACP methyl ester carboxylesterase